MSESDGAPADETQPTLEGRFFRPIEADGPGEVQRSTLFEYHQRGRIIWARYSGGGVALGFLVGVRQAVLALSFRYSQVNRHGETSSGACESEIVTLSDGRLRLSERWHWESREGSGTSVLEEVEADSG